MHRRPQCGGEHQPILVIVAADAEVIHIDLNQRVEGDRLCGICPLGFEMAREHYTLM